MYFDFEDYRPDISPVGRAISWREGVLLSIIAHLLALIFVLIFPRLFPYDVEAARARALALQQQQRPQEPTRFVFVQPRIDTPALKAPPRAEPSDIDRQARTPRRAEKPVNPLPYARGNSPERTIEDRQRQQPARGRGPAPEPAAGQTAKNPAT